MIQIQPGQPAYDDRHYLLLKGLPGLLAGETFKLNLGESVVVGRSKTCPFSLKKTAVYLRDRDGEREKIRSSLAFRSVSRRHVRLSYVAPDVVEVINLSPNGTFVDGHRVDKMALEDVRSNPHDIRLGLHGDAFRMACGSVELQPRAIKTA